MSSMLRLSVAAAVATLSAIGIAAPGQAQPEHVLIVQADHVELSQSAIEIKVAMRVLWEDHITYTRNYIISALAGLPDEQAIAERLLRNQDDIGNAIKPYYGDEAGNKLASLLRDHILIATEVVSAAKAGDNQQLIVAQGRWSVNGKDIAAFLAAANPNWSKAELEAMLQKHLDLTTGEVVGRLTSDWAADIKSYDEGHAHMLMFADLLSDGLVRQFPTKFS